MKINNKVLVVIIVFLLTILFIIGILYYIKESKKNANSDIDLNSATFSEENLVESTNDIQEEQEEQDDSNETDDGRVKIKSDEEIASEEASAEEELYFDPDKIGLYDEEESIEEEKNKPIEGEAYERYVMFYVTNNFLDDFIERYSDDLLARREELLSQEGFKDLVNVYDFNTSSLDLKNQIVTLIPTINNKEYKFHFEVSEDGMQITDITAVLEQNIEEMSTVDGETQESSLEENTAEE